MRLTRADAFPLGLLGITVLVPQVFDAMAAPPGHAFLTDDSGGWTPVFPYSAYLWLRIVLTLIPLAMACVALRRSD